MGSTDDSLHGQDPILENQVSFGAQVRLASKFPALLLEDHDHYLERVVCRESTIELSFRVEAASSAAWQEIQRHHEILIITSHVGCNANDEYRPYVYARAPHFYFLRSLANLNRTSKVRRDENRLIFSCVTTTWSQSFYSVGVSFEAQDTASLQRRSDIQYTDASQTTVTSVISSSIEIPSLPTVKPTQTSVNEAGLNMSWIDVQILPPKFPGISNSSILAASIPPPGLILNCKNCSLTGNVDITHGLLTAQGPVDSSNKAENAVQFFHHGYIELATYFEAHIELESIAVPSISLASYTAPFPDIDILGFTIPYIAEVGVIFRPRLTFGVEVDTELNFTYGFEINTPRNSSIILDIHNATRSNITGFQETQITALPFQAAVDSVNLTIGAAFTPQLLLTIGILDNSISASAGAFLDLPKISATVSKVNHVNESCDPISPNEDAKDYSFDSLTQIIPKVDADIGVLAKVDEKLSGIKPEGLRYTAWNKTWTLPTACFSFDAGKKAYVVPTPSTTSSSTSMMATTTLAGDPAKVPGSGSKSESSGFRPIELFPSPVPSFFAFVMFLLVLCYT